MINYRENTAPIMECVSLDLQVPAVTLGEPSPISRLQVPCLKNEGAEPDVLQGAFQLRKFISLKIL